LTIVNIPIDIREVAEEPEPWDELLGVYELQEFRKVSPFSGMRPGPENFPGAMILRRCRRGRVLCYQGEAGGTAFQILTRKDALNVLEALRRAVDVESKAVVDALAAGPTSEWSAEFLEELAERELSEGPDRLRRGQQLDSEIGRIRGQLESEGVAGVAAPARQVAEARILTAPDRPARRGMWDRLRGLLKSTTAARRQGGVPDYIPNDGPQDLNAGTLSAPMFEGDLFGEMSCLNRAPRSATVITTEGTTDDPVYVIEMVRNALDALRSNADYRRRMDEIYRARVMENQVRSLPLFRLLSDDDYKWLSPQLELVEFQAGDVIFDEHDAVVDRCYVIRSGMVKVSQGLGCLPGKTEILDAAVLATELKSLVGRAGIAGTVGGELLGQLTADGESRGFEELEPPALLRLLHRWMQTSKLHLTSGSDIPQLLQRAGLEEHAAVFEDFQEKPADWWQLEVRIFNRLLLERLCPQGLHRRSMAVSERRTLSYAGRGELIGEIAVLCKEPRTATCLAFTHPSSGQKLATQANIVPQRVEAVKISGEVLRQLKARSPAFHEYVEKVIEDRRERDGSVRPATPASPKQRPPSQTGEFESLGLAWGQSLMVIDLDRCTRCQECVKACVEAHDDGRTRLYLDGPRFEGRYLVPVTCRQCHDPVCMIGCPVGAINRGGSGEIRISDHCIGCSKCADQCPYGSIQMDLLDKPIDPDPELLKLLGPGYVLRSVQERAVVCDQCRSSPLGGPSCVYACPHDAAIRVEGLSFFDR
jgi:Fe-S-cluster-containing hydrogenase component 2/CRP-like cAMP-binding protein